MPIERKVELLEELDPEAGSEQALAWARDTLAEHEVAEKIRNRVAEGMEKKQREFLLRQQLQAIRKELGETADADDTVAEYRREARRGGPARVVSVAVEREIDQLERTSEQSPEHGWIRTWIDTMLELPWGKRSEERIDVMRRGASSTRTTPVSTT